MFLFTPILAFSLVAHGSCDLALAGLHASLASARSTHQSNVLDAYRAMISNLSVEDLQNLERGGKLKFESPLESKTHAYEQGMEIIKFHLDQWNLPTEDIEKIFSDVLADKRRAIADARIKAQQTDHVQPTYSILPTQDLEISKVRFTDDNTLVAFLTDYQPDKIFRWNAATGVVVEPLDRVVHGFVDDFHANGERIAFLDSLSRLNIMGSIAPLAKKIVHRWKWRRPECFHLIENGNILAVQFEKLFRSQISILNLNTGVSIDLPSRRVRGNKFSGAGDVLFRQLNTSSFFWQKKNDRQATMILDLRSMTEITPEAWKHRPIHFIGVSPHGEFAVSHAPETSKGVYALTIWNLATGEERVVEFQGVPVGALFWTANVSADGRRVTLVSGHPDHFNLLDAETGKHLRYSNLGPVQFTFRLSDDGKFIVELSDEGTVKLYDTETGNLLHTPDVFKEISFLTFSPDSKYLALVKQHGGIIVWELPT